MPAVGMRRRVLIFLPSKKGAGCNARQPFVRCWIVTKAAYEGTKHSAGQLSRDPSPARIALRLHDAQCRRCLGIPPDLASRIGLGIQVFDFTPERRQLSSHLAAGAPAF